MTEKNIAIAIDGPAGAGKSSLAKALAKKLGFVYVDTGALYRSIGLAFSRKGFDTSLNCDIEEQLKDINVDIRFIDGAQHVFLGGEDVSEAIRTNEASMMASAVSAKKEVRAFLLEMQRDFARKYSCIMDGRDIGTVVLPKADLKIFLTASDEERAMRRFKELQAKGDKTTYEEVLRSMRERDYNDSHRTIAPLKPAEDAIIADTTGKNVEQSVEMLLQIIKEKNI